MEQDADYIDTNPRTKVGMDYQDPTAEGETDKANRHGNQSRDDEEHEVGGGHPDSHLVQTEEATEMEDSQASPKRPKKIKLEKMGDGHRSGRAAERVTRLRRKTNFDSTSSPHKCTPNRDAKYQWTAYAEQSCHAARLPEDPRYRHILTRGHPPNPR
jgi:hypothetical protein